MTSHRSRWVQSDHQFDLQAPVRHLNRFQIVMRLLSRLAGDSNYKYAPEEEKVKGQ